jgi:hypothetical protein
MIIEALAISFHIQSDDVISNDVRIYREWCIRLVVICLNGAV